MQSSTKNDSGGSARYLARCLHCGWSEQAATYAEAGSFAAEHSATCDDPHTEIDGPLVEDFREVFSSGDDGGAADEKPPYAVRCSCGWSKDAWFGDKAFEYQDAHLTLSEPLHTTEEEHRVEIDGPPRDHSRSILDMLGDIFEGEDSNTSTCRETTAAFNAESSLVVTDSEFEWLQRILTEPMSPEGVGKLRRLFERPSVFSERGAGPTPLALTALTFTVRWYGDGVDGWVAVARGFDGLDAFELIGDRVIRSSAHSSPERAVADMVALLLREGLAQ